MTVRPGQRAADRPTSDVARPVGVTVSADEQRIAALARLVAAQNQRIAAQDKRIADQDSRIAALEAKRRDRRKDVDRDADVVVRAILDVVGYHSFNAAEVIAHARTDVALRTALNDVGVRNVSAADDSKSSAAMQLGQRLARAAGRDVDGVRLICIDEDRNGMIWHIVRT